tara:strand:- start:3043 stop:3399 length:357 start_codon:yes stop_codon:yes gene_type:complete
MQRGFSLIEMLVALSVLSIAGLALMTTTRETVRAGSIVEERSLSALAAENILNERLARAPQGAVRNEYGTYELAGREWAWTLSVDATTEAGLNRIVLTLTDTRSDRVAAQIITFGQGS